MSGERNEATVPREFQGRQVLIALNMTHREQIVRYERRVGELLLSTYLDAHDPCESGEMHLRADEGLVLGCRA